MSADALLQALTNGFFYAMFAIVTVRAARWPRRAHIDAALFFAALVSIIATPRLGEIFQLEPAVRANIQVAVFLVLPYLLLRMVDDLVGVPRWVMLIGAVGAAAYALYALVFGYTPTELIVALPYFVPLSLYAAAAVFEAARRATGVTQRRLQAIAAGFVLLGAALPLVALPIVFPPVADATRLITRLLGIALGAAFFLGFAPPGMVRRAWQEPELRALLARASDLPRLGDTAAIVRELARRAAAALGAKGAGIALWDEQARKLRGISQDGEAGEFAPSQYIAGRAFTAQRAIFSENAPRDDPQNAAAYEQAGATAVLSAPVTAGDKRLGVLTVFGPRPSIFADEDLALLRLLAEQAAVILESRALIDEAARVRAHEEAARLKEDFVSAAAHDLKTPLTTIVAQTQFLERKASADEWGQQHLPAIQRVSREAQRLNGMVLELLDAARMEQGALVTNREPTDLKEVAGNVIGRRAGQVQLETNGGVVGLFDRGRIEQLLENLVENAVKFSAGRTPVRVRLWRENAQARIAVEDRGIGVPAEDLDHLFERFHRGSNVDDRRYAGMGLGLYICRGIVEGHGGRIWAESRVGEGSTFHVGLPLGTEERS